VSKEEIVIEAPLVVGIGGSVWGNSATSQLLQAGLGHCAARGARTQMFAGTQLAELPFYGLSEVTDDSTAVALVSAVRQADAIIVATPGYHGGMSGLVKNALDHLEELREDQRPYLHGRAVGIMVAAAGWQGCGAALTAARSAVHALRGWPTPYGVTVNSVEQRATAGGHFPQPVDDALSILAEQLMQFTTRRAVARMKV